MDVLVVLGGPLHLFDDLSAMVRSTYHLRFASGRPLHLVPVTLEDYEAGTWRICRDARREGVAA